MYDITYMRNLKKKQTHRDTEQNGGYQGLRGGGIGNGCLKVH